MRKFIITLLAIVGFNNLNAQDVLRDYLDSIIGFSSFTDRDWAVSYYKSGSGLYDSLGNSLPMPDYKHYIVIVSLNNVQYVQIFEDDLENAKNPRYKNRVKLPDNVKFSYTADSILIVKDEFIYPFIYKERNRETYNYQEQSLPSDNYELCFYLKNYSKKVYFNENSFIMSLSFSPDFPINLNYTYNINTFIFRYVSRFEHFLNLNRSLLLMK